MPETTPSHQLSDNRLPLDPFMVERREVLSGWKTGADVDLDDAFAYHHQLPESKKFPEKLKLADDQHITLIQPRAGVPLIAEHIKLLTYLQNEGEADLLPTTIDSYTRQNRYREAENGI